MDPSLDSWLDIENSTFQYFFFSCLLCESNELQRQFVTRDEIHKQIYSWFCEKLRVWTGHRELHNSWHTHIFYVSIFLQINLDL